MKPVSLDQAKRPADPALPAPDRRLHVSFAVAPPADPTEGQGRPHAFSAPPKSSAPPVDSQEPQRKPSVFERLVRRIGKAVSGNEEPSAPVERSVARPPSQMTLVDFRNRLEDIENRRKLWTDFLTDPTQRADKMVEFDAERDRLFAEADQARLLEPHRIAPGGSNPTGF